MADNNKKPKKAKWYKLVKKMEDGETLETLVEGIPLAVKIKLNPKNRPMSTKQSKATRNG